MAKSFATSEGDFAKKKFEFEIAKKPKPMLRFFKSHFRITIIAVILLAFGAAICAEFVTYDDDLHTYKNPMFRSINGKTLWDIWSAPYWGMYIPLTYTLWMVISFLSKTFAGGFVPWPFHLANVLVHAANTVLVFSLLKKLIPPKISNREHVDLAALMGALFFGLHPIHVEPVAWVSGMKDVLCGFMSLVSLNLYFTVKEDNKPFFLNARYIMAFLIFILACLSKPSAISVPFIAFIMDCAFMGKSGQKSAARLLPWLAAGLAFSVIAKMLQPGTADSHANPYLLGPFISIDTSFFYFKKIIWPDFFYHDYGRKIQNLHQYLLTCLLPLLYAGFFCAVCAMKGQRIWIWLFFMFLVSLGPNSGLIPFSFQKISIVADRYAYLAVFPFSIAVFLVLKNTDKKILTLAAVFLFFLFVKTFAQSLVWQNNFTLNNHALMLNPRSYISHINLGLAYAGQNRFMEAVRQYRKSIDIDPANDLAYFDLGVAYACMGDQDMANEQVTSLKVLGKPGKAASLEDTISKIKTALEANKPPEPK